MSDEALHPTQHEVTTRDARYADGHDTDTGNCVANHQHHTDSTPTANYTNRTNVRNRERTVFVLCYKVLLVLLAIESTCTDVQTMQYYLCPEAEPRRRCAMLSCSRCPDPISVLRILAVFR